MPIPGEGLSGHNTHTIIMIGPVLPFRGGIAQHTTQFARALAATTDCHVISFKRLYPKWLFPGQSDRNPDYQGHVEQGTEYLLDSMSPLTWRQGVQKGAQRRPDFVLIPWRTFFLAPKKF